MDYKNAKIYSVRSPNTEYIYIGSTCSSLSKRFYQHKLELKRWENKDPFTSNSSCNIVLKTGNAYIELIKYYPCNSRDELAKEKGKYIRSEINCCNKEVSGRTEAEYYQDNRNRIREYQRQRLKEKIECNSCKCMISKKHFERHKKTRKHMKNLHITPYKC